MLPTCLCLLLGLVALSMARKHGAHRRALVEIELRYRGFLNRIGLTCAEDFLDIPGLIVSGHPDRNVARVKLEEGDETIVAYLKREHRSSWPVRLINWLAGFGWASRSIRETRVLQALAREGIGSPEWMAAGEDGRGRAFILTRQVQGAIELREFLSRETDPARRLALACNLGATLARLHDTGFDHPDLYAKHVLVDPRSLAISFLDWQRSRRARLPGWDRRGRDLAALALSVPDGLTSPRERHACLEAYLAYPGSLKALSPEEARRQLQAAVRAASARLLQHRHVHEKRQLPAAESQDWSCVEGEGLCVSSGLATVWPGRGPGWLALGKQPAGQSAVARRWLPVADERRALLIRRRAWNPAAVLWAWLRPPALATPEQRQAELLLRLQRHGVHGPAVLAMGQRRDRLGRVDSFLLTEPPANALKLDLWLARRARLGGPDAERVAVLRQAGSLLRRLHQASCYLDAPKDSPLAVSPTQGGTPCLVLDGVESLTTRRRLQPSRAVRDLRRLRGALAEAGCSAADLGYVLEGYQERPTAAVLASAASARVPDCTGDDTSPESQ